MPKVGMQPIRRSQLIAATLEAVDQVGMGDATMRHLMQALSDAVRQRRAALRDDNPRAHLRAIIEGNFDDSQVSGPAMKTWLAFWATSMHQPTLRRLQRVNDHRLYSNLCGQLHRVLPQEQARTAARGLAALIDGLWLRGALSGEGFDTRQALQIAYEYLDLQLAKAG